MTAKFGRAALVAAVAVVIGAGSCAPSTADKSHLRADAAPPPVSAADAGSGWSSVHADGANSDFTPQPGARSLEPAWSRTFDGNINLGATTSPDGSVYVTTNSGPGCHLHVLDLETGATRWCSDEVDRFASISGVLLDRQGNAYLADGEAMHSFAPDGTVRWETPLVGVPLSAQMTPAGRVLVVTHLGQIVVLDRTTGEPVLEPLELVPGATFDPAVGVGACARGLEACPSANTVAVDASGRIYFTFWEPGAPQAGVRAMDLVEGDDETTLVPAWTNDALPGGSGSSPTLSPDGERVYVNDNVDSVHALDTDTGETIWSVEVGYASGGSPSRSADGLVMPAGGAFSPVLAVQDHGDRGELVWQDPDLLNRGIATQAAGDVAYVTVARQGPENDLVVLDTSSGQVLERHQLPGVSGFSVGTTVGPDGTVLVPTIRGQLHAFVPA
jgi:outer membrane protein assembly factor BamB